MGGQQGRFHPEDSFVNRRVVIVDANLAFKALVSNRGDLRGRLAQAGEDTLSSPRFLFVELFKHRYRLVAASGLAEEDVIGSMHTLVSGMEFVNEGNIPLGTWMEAYRLCKGVDEQDTPYVALTLHLDGRLWTEDRVLQGGLRARGFDRFFTP